LYTSYKTKGQSLNKTIQTTKNDEPMFPETQYSHKKQNWHTKTRQKEQRIEGWISYYMLCCKMVFGLVIHTYIFGWLKMQISGLGGQALASFRL